MPLEQCAKPQSKFGLFPFLDLKKKEMINSKSQFGQDYFVGGILMHNQRGFFVDVGAKDGVDNSNTFLLEKSLNWSGICVEPHPDLFQICQQERTCHSINVACSNSKENNLDFVKYMQKPYGHSGLLETFTHTEALKKVKHEIISVTTLTLTEILEKYNAPRLIDYLDIDTEGHEESVLKSIDFDKYEFRYLSCEVYPDTERFEKISNFLAEQNYIPLFQLHADTLFVKKK